MNRVLAKAVQNLPYSQRIESIWVQAKVSFLKRYYGSVGGVIWAFINPMVQFLVYYVVFEIIIHAPEENRAVSLMLGLILWTFVSESAAQGIRLLFQKRFIIENLPFNRLDLYSSALLSGLFSFSINILIYVLFAIFFGVILSWSILFFPILFFNLLLFVLALQLILSVTFPVIRDVTHLWDKLKLGLFWMSGVVYPMAVVSSPMKEILLWSNPLAGIFMNIKNVCVYNKPVDITVMIWNFFVCALFLVFGVWINRRYFYKATEKL